MIIPNATYAVPRRRYDTDLSDAEWEEIKADIAPAQTGKGRRRTVDLREVWNAIAYKLRTSCPWRLLPKDFPHYKSRTTAPANVPARWSARHARICAEVLDTTQSGNADTINTNLTPSLQQ